MNGRVSALRAQAAAQRAQAAATDAEANALEAAGDLGAPASDALIVFPFDLEVKAARALIRSGKLPAARIGRKVYARRSNLLALVDELAPARAEPSPMAPAVESYDEVISIARAKAKRVAR